MKDYAPLGPFDDNGTAVDQSAVVRENGVQRTPRKVILQYVAYGSALGFIAIAALSFWLASACKPILFSYELGLLIRANTKFTTIACTIVGALLSAVTIWLLNRLLQLMSTQIIASRGATLSTIEGRPSRDT